MPIEFRCHQCNKLLRVGDETAGKQAKCPSCGTVQQIPDSPPAPAPPAMPPADVHFGSPFAAAPPPPDYPGAEQNPYRSPTELQAAPMGYGSAGPGVPERGFRPTLIDAGDILSRTWEIFKIHWGMCTLAFFLVWIIQFGLGLAVAPLAALTLKMAGIGQNEPAGQIANQFMVQLAGFLLGTWLETGLSMFMLNVARGQAPNISDVFAGGRYYPAMLAARFLFTLMYLFGLLLCIVPGVMLALIFFQYYFIIIDRDEGAIESLRLSSQITSGNKGSLFILGLVMMGVGILGALALCVGVFFATGFNYLMLAVAYLAMTGQRTADQMYAQPTYR